MHWLPASGRPASPWKNGGGCTRKVVAFPFSCTLETFSWRLSIASVQSDGPFSRFVDVDRILAVISPGTLALHRAGRGLVELDEATPPYRFAGEESVTGALRGMPIVDLNLMLRRTMYDGSIERVQLRARNAIGERRAETIIVALDPVELDGKGMSVHDAAWLNAGEMAALSPQAGASRVMVAKIWRTRQRAADAGRPQ